MRKAGEMWKCGETVEWIMDYGLWCVTDRDTIPTTYIRSHRRPSIDLQDPYQINAAADIYIRLKMLQECFFGEKLST